jgi:hypothetical protein
MTMMGKLPYLDHPRNSSPSFREVLGQFAETGALPPLPDTWSWTRTIAPDDWQQYGNNEVGDCTIAAACHMMMCWSDNTESTPWSFDNDDVVADYNDFRTSKDGASIQNILWDWKAYGIHRRAAGAKVPVKIDDFALLDINDQLRLKSQVQRSIQLLGCCYIGVILPKFAVNYVAGDPNPKCISPPQWDITADALKLPNAEKDPKAGHAVAAIGYNPDGLQIVTWGLCATMSWAFFFAYMDEAWSVLCKAAWLKPEGLTPSGLTVAQLADDFNTLKSSTSK